METSIVERVKKVRSENKVSQIEFANTLGVSASYIAGLEMGRNSLNQKFLQAIKEKYNVSIDWLMFGEESASNTLDIDILKIVAALDNYNRLWLSSVKETIARAQKSDKIEDKNLLEASHSEEFKTFYNNILKLESEKNDLYRSILEDVTFKDKSNFDLTDKIKQYSEINLEFYTICKELYEGLEFFEPIDSNSITQLLKER
ncbi:helix-turn-helix transcriptional regulator [Marinifilum fragile]|uniref:helix-turn-helix domain-containing protein n=1 Tax=Marinifilum fragile TaxID=570161 RepID=UPI002AA5F6EE|nr:helix-turn-helix transcriptional regulator [Marinifilum fragile]